MVDLVDIWRNLKTNMRSWEEGEKEANRASEM